MHLRFTDEEPVARMAERELTKKYWQEFSRNGIANLHVVAKREDG